MFMCNGQMYWRGVLLDTYPTNYASLLIRTARAFARELFIHLSTMWLKLCLLLIYITVLFLLARILETVTWYETGSLSRRLLDPMALSVAKLKALLEQRGVSYDTVVEKSELCQLVDGSGMYHVFFHVCISAHKFVLTVSNDNMITKFIVGLRAAKVRYRS